MRIRPLLLILLPLVAVAGWSCDESTSPPSASGIDNNFSMEFQGSNSCVEIGRPSILQPSQFTVEMWVYIDTIVSAYTPFMSASVDERNTADGYSLKYESDRFYGRVAVASNVAASYWALLDAPVRQWFHLATTHDGNQGKVFINGLERASYPSVGPVWYGSASLWLGCGYHSDFGGFSFFRGKLDEVRIWDRARTEAELLGSMGYALSGSEPGLVGYWNFDDTTHTSTVLDESSHNNHGLMWGATARVPDSPF